MEFSARIYSVDVCPHCRKTRQQGAWVEMPIELAYKLNADENVSERSRKCPECQEKHGTSNRLIPVQDKSAMALSAGR